MTRIVTSRLSHGPRCLRRRGCGGAAFVSGAWSSSRNLGPDARRGAAAGGGGAGARGAATSGGMDAIDSGVTAHGNSSADVCLGGGGALGSGGFGGGGGGGSAGRVLATGAGGGGGSGLGGGAGSSSALVLMTGMSSALERIIRNP